MRRHVLYLLLGLLAVLMVADLLRSFVHAFEPNKTDFSEVYTTAWLWAHRQNPYDSALATATQQRLVGAVAQISPVYLPTGLALVSPFTFLPWVWANILWLLIGLGGVAATSVALVRLRGPAAPGPTFVFVTFLLSFSPLHLAFHLGNPALMVVPLTLWSVLLAERERDLWAGLLLAVAVSLKPQIAIWVLLYYVMRGRKRVLLGALISGGVVMAVVLFQAGSLLHLVPDYRANLHYWFAPNRPFGFTEGAFPFHVSSSQVVFYGLTHSILGARLIAHGLFLTGLAVWTTLLWRSRFLLPAPLAISSVCALSFLSLYHSVSDAMILLLALCWAWRSEPQAWSRTKIAICVLFLLLMLPGHSLLMRISPDLGPSVTTAWWWAVFVARYFVWLLLALNVVLLMALWEAARNLAEKGGPQLNDATPHNRLSPRGVQPKEFPTPTSNRLNWRFHSST